MPHHWRKYDVQSMGGHGRAGGRMGILHPGGRPAGFEAFAYGQSADTIHPAVVETVYGFHLVWKVN